MVPLNLMPGTGPVTERLAQVMMAGHQNLILLQETAEFAYDVV
jgi:hypothetical protein